MVRRAEGPAGEEYPIDMTSGRLHDRGAWTEDIDPSAVAWHGTAAAAIRPFGPLVHSSAPTHLV
jgi:hypothetical protein